MRTFLVRSALLVCLLPIACADEVVDQESGDWQGTITTEGDVTNVVNESGSVWGGTAKLVEEASIGVETGDEPYLFGDVVGVGVAADEVFVVDTQVLRVRAYDRDGIHLRDLGEEGDGPGEFRRPTGLAVGSDRVYVWDPQLGRISVFSVEGPLVETWPTRPLFTPIPIIATTTGDLLVPSGGAMVPWGPDGPTGGQEVPFPDFETRPPRMTLRISESVPGFSAGAVLGRYVPFWPVPVFSMSATGAMIYGSASGYRFTIEEMDGRRVQIEIRAEPISVQEEEASWHRSRVEEHMRRGDPGWQWDGPEIPATKPAYTEFIPAVSGEVWVARPGLGYESTSCEPSSRTAEVPETCWKKARIIEAFGADGRFLGTIGVPEELRFYPRPFIRDDMVVGVVEDEAGTIMVKRYRLVLPGEE